LVMSVKDEEVAQKKAEEKAINKINFISFPP
jgi:hypothetical protein